LLYSADKPYGRATDLELRRAADRDDDAESLLVEAARELREEAWAEIYRRHATQVYTYIYYRLGDRHAAEDLTSDVFVRALAGIKGYVWRGTPLLAWLYRIAHNVTADYRKAAARRAEQRAEAPAETAEAADVSAGVDERADMLRAIRALTDDQQQVIVLRFYVGMSVAEVARVVGKPQGAVKALQARGLRSLRRVMDAGVERETA
jgi:RNA polymerase sigma-70 factor (ECF subfamily)